MAPAPRFSPDEQERIILDAAAHCIEQSSLLDFTMSAIAKEAGLSMGSIYKHVQSKEDVLVALATRVQRHYHNDVSRLMALPLTPVQRIIAINLMDAVKLRLYSFDHHLGVLMNSAAVLKRASAHWRDKLMASELQCDKLYTDFFQGLANSGELSITSPTTVEELELASWTITVGYWQIARQYRLRMNPEELDGDITPLTAESPVIKMVQRLLSTFDWRQPLTDEQVVQTCHILEQHGLR